MTVAQVVANSRPDKLHYRAYHFFAQVLVMKDT